eukprot:3916311-Amphidinium_carterae.1
MARNEFLCYMPEPGGTVSTYKHPKKILLGQAAIPASRMLNLTRDQLTSCTLCLRGSEDLTKGHQRVEAPSA